MSTGEPTEPTQPTSATGAAAPPPGPGPAQSPTAFPTSSGPGVAPPPTPPPADAPGAADLPGSPPPRHEWPAQAADLVVDVVDRVSSATTGPILTVARGVVYGLAALILGSALLVLVVIALIRGLDVAIPGDVWIVYTGLGALFTLVGMFAWSKRRVPAA